MFVFFILQKTQHCECIQIKEDIPQFLMIFNSYLYVQNCRSIFSLFHTGKKIKKRGGIAGVTSRPLSVKDPPPYLTMGVRYFSTWLFFSLCYTKPTSVFFCFFFHKALFWSHLTIKLSPTESSSNAWHSVGA